MQCLHVDSAYGIAITTYEQGEQDSWVPTLTHVFWGDDLQSALGVAKSHLVTDYFFSSSMLGTMPWQGGELILGNECDVLGAASNKGACSRILSQLRQHVEGEPEAWTARLKMRIEPLRGNRS